MARSRRRAVSRRPRRKTDWVYRSNMYGLGGGATPLQQVDIQGTYEWSVRGLTAGYGTSQVLWLVDAQDREWSIAPYSATGVAATMQSKAAKPAARRTKCLFVEGHIYFEPTTWAVGNLMAVGARIVAMEQDILTGFAVLDADYTMWNNGMAGPGRGAAAIYANDRQLNMWEKRMYKAFTSNNEALMVMHIRARLNWALQPHHGLGILLEAESTSVNLRYQTWLRTLVEVP